jgi:hypothetical protein
MPLQTIRSITLLCRCALDNNLCSRDVNISDLQCTYCIDLESISAPTMAGWEELIEVRLIYLFIVIFILTRGCGISGIICSDNILWMIR